MVLGLEAVKPRAGTRVQARVGGNAFERQCYRTVALALARGRTEGTLHSRGTISGMKKRDEPMAQCGKLSLRLTRAAAYVECLWRGFDSLRAGAGGWCRALSASPRARRRVPDGTARRSKGTERVLQTAFDWELSLDNGESTRWFPPTCRRRAAPHASVTATQSASTATA